MVRQFLRYTLLFSLLLSGSLRPDSDEGNLKASMALAAISTYVLVRSASSALKTHNLVKRQNQRLRMYNQVSPGAYQSSVPMSTCVKWFWDCLKGKSMPDTYGDHNFEIKAKF